MPPEITNQVVPGQWSAKTRQFGARFNPPATWPPVPDGWTPPPGRQPDPSWPPRPEGWQLWLPDAPDPEFPRSSFFDGEPATGAMEYPISSSTGKTAGPAQEPAAAPDRQPFTPNPAGRQLALELYEGPSGNAAKGSASSGAASSSS
ncbi:hypothetical protein KIH74_08890 [Kineosporia sp. J2-2]|uniref:Uncharacterized protein n=1 Tax=Kineosporia corallincola TaxID=2835133 RepID=A0ABS5TDC5_9ACTN|nr:hypothetical protein [Kineosporia corallincola]MBT0769041.1 hypothetical protein [Kineosporia corallincola]